MAGSATIGSSLIDEMVSLVDDLRDDLHTDFGLRQFNVYLVTRSWDGGYIGEGSYTDSETLIEPDPKVQPYMTELNLEPCGIDEAGFLKLTEVSLTYTESELTGAFGSDASITSAQEFFYKIADAHGQGIETTYWVTANKPYPDRDTMDRRGYGTIGWHVKLRRAGVP